MNGNALLVAGRALILLGGALALVLGGLWAITKEPLKRYLREHYGNRKI